MNSVYPVSSPQHPAPWIIGPGVTLTEEAVRQYEGLFEIDFSQLRNVPAGNAYDTGGMRYDLLAYGVNRGSDISEAFNDLVDTVRASGNQGTIWIPWGVYNVSTPLRLKPGVSLQMDKHCRLVATQAMSAVIYTDAADLCEDQFIAGGIVDCAELAQVGIHPRCFRHFTIRDSLVRNFAVSGVRLGDAAAAFSTYEGVIHNLRTHRPSNPTPVGSICLDIPHATDCHVSQCVLIGGETGVLVDTGGNFFNQVHCWTRASTGYMKWCFKDTNVTSNIYANCYADSPSVYGWWFTGFNAVMVGCAHFNGENSGSGLDNVVTSIKFDQLNPYATLLATRFFGATASYRILRDIEFGTLGTPGDSVTILGSVWGFTTNSTRPRFQGSLQSLTAQLASIVGSLTVGSNLVLNGNALDLNGTGGNIPEMTGTADSEDAATAITTHGVSVSSDDANRRVIRFRVSGDDNKAGSGGVAFGKYNDNDYLIHRFEGSGLRIDFLNFLTNTVTKCFELFSTGYLYVKHLLTEGVDLDTAAGTSAAIGWFTNSVSRWLLRSDGVAETGSNAGTNLQLIRRADDGSALGTTMSVNRSTGLVSFTDKDFKVNGSWEQPFWMGPRAVWFDSTSKMRFKDGTPTGETDGTIIGTQT